MYGLFHPVSIRGIKPKNARRYQQIKPVYFGTFIFFPQKGPSTLEPCFVAPSGLIFFISFRYFYRLLTGSEALSTFEEGRAWHVPEELDVLAMQVFHEIPANEVFGFNLYFNFDRTLNSF